MKWTYTIDRRTYATTAQPAEEGDLEFSTKTEAVDALHKAMIEKAALLSSRLMHAMAEIDFFWVKYTKETEE